MFSRGMHNFFHDPHFFGYSRYRSRHSPQRTISFHHLLSPASSSITLTVCMSAFTTFLTLLFGRLVYPSSGSFIFNILVPIYPVCLS